MKAEDGVIDDCCQWKVVKQLGEVDPNVRVSVLSKAFIIETIDLSDLADFVISTENG